MVRGKKANNATSAGVRVISMLLCAAMLFSVTGLTVRAAGNETDVEDSGYITEQPSEQAATTEQSPEPENTGDPEETEQSAEKLFGEGAMYLEEFLEKHPDAKVIGGWSETMTMSAATKTVEANYFSFTVRTVATDGTPTTTEYADFNALKADYPNVDAAWAGVPVGNYNADHYPVINGWQVSNITVNSVALSALGFVTVDGEDKIFVSAGGNGSTVSAVLGENVKISVNYLPVEYNITYVVEVDGTVVLSETTDTWAGGPNGFKNLDGFFGSRRAAVTTDQWFGVDVTIPMGFYGHVFLNGTEVTGSDTNYLGEDQVYRWQTGNVSRTSGPDFFTLSGSYVSGDSSDVRVNTDQTVTLKLTKRTDYNDCPTLNPMAITGKLGSANNCPLNNNNSFTPIRSGTTWQLTLTETRISGATSYMMDSLEINGESINIPFLNSANGRAELKTSLSTGEEVIVAVTTDGGTLVNGTRYYHRTYSITVNNALRNVNITAISFTAFSSSAGTNPTFTMQTVTGAYVYYFRSDLGTGSGSWIALNQNDSRVGYTFTPTNSAALPEGAVGAVYPASGSYNLMFKAKDGYGWTKANNNDDPGSNITFGLNNPEGNELAGNLTNITYGGNGWYFAYLTQPSAQNVTDTYYLSIIAQALRYQVEYQDGLNSHINSDTLTNMLTVEADTVPQLNTNNDHYYTVPGNTNEYDSNSVTLDPDSPVATSSSTGQDVAFQGWVVVNSDGYPIDADGNVIQPESNGRYNAASLQILWPGSVVTVEYINGGATLVDADNRIYSIYLAAWWVEHSDEFTYYVTLHKTDSQGNTTNYLKPVNGKTGAELNGITMPGGNIAAGEYYDTLSGLGAYINRDIIFSSGDAVVRNWLKWNPCYKLDNTKNPVLSGSPDSFYYSSVSPNGEIAVWFVSTLGDLTVSKTVEGGADTETEFTIYVSFTLPENDSDTAVDESHYFGTEAPYKVTTTDGKTIDITEENGVYTAVLTLKHDESVTFELPDGTGYTVTEEDVTPTYLQPEKIIGSVTAGTTVYAEVVNAPGGGVLIEKSQTVNGTDASNSNVPVQVFDIITYSIHLTNRMEEGNTVKVVDPTPVGLTVLEDTISNEGSYDAATGTITWSIELDEGGEETLTFQVIVPLVEKETVFANTATVAFMNDDGENVDKQSNTVTAVAEPYWLSVTKTVVGQATDKADDKFIFNVTLTGDGVAESYQYITYEGTTPTTTATDIKTLVLDNGVGTIELTGGETALIYGLPAEVTYSVSEDTSGMTDYILTGSEGTSGTISVTPGRAAFTNTAVYDVTISKKVNSKNEDDFNKDFEFTVTLTLPDGLSAPQGGYSYIGGIIVDGVTAPVTGTVNEGTNTIHLKHGQSITIQGVPIGTVITAVEVLDTDSEFIYTVKDNSGDTGDGKVTIEAVGTAAENSRSINFINALKSGDLRINKIVPNYVIGDDTEFTFTVTLSDNTINETYGEYTFVDGVCSDITITVSVDSEDATRYIGSAVIEGLPDGVGYSIEETSAGTKYIPSWTNNTGSISSGTETVATCENVKTCVLVLEKVVTGNSASRTDPFDFKITLIGADEDALKNIKATYNDGKTDTEKELTFTNGSVDVELAHGQSIKIEGLPAGVSYKIEEIGASTYDTTISSTNAADDVESTDKAASGTVLEWSTGGTIVTFTNERNGSVPTDATIESLWLIPLMMAACTGVFALVLKKRRTA